MSKIRSWKPSEEQCRLGARSYQLLANIAMALSRDDSRTPRDRFASVGLLFEHEIHRLGFNQRTIRIRRIDWEPTE